MLRPSLAIAALLLSCVVARAAPTIATAGGAVRDARGMIDVDGTLDALQRLGATEYLYDLPADSDAWARLPAFAEAAAKRKIRVDVYLAPWSQARKGGKTRQDGPFGVDYVAWCAAIADVARDHPAIRGVVMDDFGANQGPERFTPTLVAEMRKRLSSGERPLAFRPVLYFDEPLDALLDQYGRFLGEGVILCYPRSPHEVDVALATLHDRPRGAQLFTELPKKHKLRPGQGTFAMARLTREQVRDARQLTFFADDFDAIGKGGRHWLIARVNGHDVWRRELLGGGGGNVTINLPPKLRGAATIELGVVADAPAEDAVVRIAYDDVTVRDGRGNSIESVAWVDDVDDGIRFEITPASTGGGRESIAMTLLVAGSPSAHEKIFAEAPTPAAVAAKFAESLAWAREGKADGVISWALPLENKAILDATKQAIEPSK